MTNVEHDKKEIEEFSALYAKLVLWLLVLLSAFVVVVLFTALNSSLSDGYTYYLPLLLLALLGYATFFVFRS